MEDQNKDDEVFFKNFALPIIMGVVALFGIPCMILFSPIWLLGKLVIAILDELQRRAGKDSNAGDENSAK